MAVTIVPVPGDAPSRLAAMAVLGTALLAGCRTPRPNPAAEAAISRAVAPGVDVTFRTEGGPLDEPPAGDALTLLDATRRAVTSDPRIQGALARVRLAMAEADQARLLPNPVLDLVLRWGPGKPNVEVSMAQELVRAFQIPTLSSAADNRMRRTAADAVTAALDVTAEVQEAYAAAQASDRLVPVIEDGIDSVRRLAGIARSRLAAGEGVRGDVTTLEAQLEALEVEAATERIRGRENRLRLARLVGEPSGSATWILDPWSPPDAVVEDERVWIDLALKHRPEVQSIAWELAALGDGYALTRLLPWEGAGAGIDVQKGDDWFAGPSISTPLPVFDAGEARRSGATAAQMEIRHALTLARRRVVEDVRVAHRALEGNIAVLRRIRDRLIPLELQRRGEAEQAFRAGQTDVTPLHLAEQGLRAVQAAAIDVEREATIARVRLHRAVGGPGVTPGVRR
jgi:cobalt-zinc-cadmium efflux system outer membrane protein